MGILVLSDGIGVRLSSACGMYSMLKEPVRKSQMSRNTASSHKEVIVRGSSTVVQDTYVEEKWVCDSRLQLRATAGSVAAAGPLSSS